MRNGGQIGARTRAMRLGGALLASLCTLGIPAVAARAQEAPPAGGANVAAARELGRAILIARAAQRREVEAEIAPTMEAVKDLREALRLYAAEHVDGADAAAAASPAPTTAQARRGRRQARRQAAREALRTLRARGEILTRTWRQRPADADGADTRAIRPEALAAIEAAVATVVDAPVAASDADAARRAAALHALLDRLAPPGEHEPVRPAQPTFSFTDARAPYTSEEP